MVLFCQRRRSVHGQSPRGDSVDLFVVIVQNKAGRRDGACDVTFLQRRRSEDARSRQRDGYRSSSVARLECVVVAILDARKSG